MPTRRQRQQEVKRQLKAGHELSFSPVDVLGNKVLSHTIRRTPKGYVAIMARRGSAWTIPHIRGGGTGCRGAPGPGQMMVS